MLGIGNGIVYALYQLYKTGCFVIILRFVEVRAHPLAQVFCFTYIQQFAFSIIVFVTTRLAWNGPDNLSKVFSRHFIYKNRYSTRNSLVGPVLAHSNSCMLI